MIGNLIPLLLSLTIAASWNRLQVIFSETRDRSVLLAPGTAIACTLSLSAGGLAASKYDPATGGTLIALGIALAIIGRSIWSSMLGSMLPIVSLLLYVRLG